MMMGSKTEAVSKAGLGKKVGGVSGRRKKDDEGMRKERRTRGEGVEPLEALQFSLAFASSYLLHYMLEKGKGGGGSGRRGNEKERRSNSRRSWSGRTA